MTLRIVSWNVLAAPWALPQWYPRRMDLDVLDRVRRRELVAEAIGRLRPDLCCLQEVTPVDLDATLAAFGRSGSHFVSEGRELWSNWGSVDVPWEPNGTAIVWDDERFDEIARDQVELGPHGNFAASVDIVDRVTTRTLRVVSVHLDSDDPDRRRSEIPRLLTACADQPVVVIAGDYNEDTITSGSDRSRIGDAFFDVGFVDVFDSLGRRAPTHPYARPGDDWEALATIDHVLVRGLTPSSATVVDACTWAIETPEARMEECLRRTGSDHLALVVECE
jgi:endonuclease/exonuclease/phosphatase family metal-dependent hydrolase